MNTAYNDGGIEYGGSALTITPKADANPARSDLSAFIATTTDNFTLDEDVKENDVTNQFAEYNGGFGIFQKKAGSCKILLPAGRRAFAGDTFTVDVSGNELITAGQTVFQITKVDHPYENSNPRTQTINYFRRKYALDQVTLNPPAET